jgi:peptidoglycan/xylan/chitin deacetylase (PgdA/CDA1 family)
MTSVSFVLLIVVLAACGGPTPTPPTPTPSAVQPAAASPTPAGAIPGTTTPGSPPPIVSHGPADGNRVALTFDSNMTESMLAKLKKNPKLSYANARVLNELEKANAPATFFLASLWVQRYPEMTRRIAANPQFEIASHSYAHRGFTNTCYDLGSLPPNQMAADVEHSFDVLRPYGGHQTRYFRFPGGCYDKTALQAIAPAGCTVIQYSVVAADPFNHNVKDIESNVLTRARAGSIIVMHITEANAPDTDKALPSIIAGLHKRGLRLVTLSALLGQD